MKIKNPFLVIMVFLVLLSSCSGKEEKSTEKQDQLNAAFLSKTETAKATLGNQKETLTLTGKIECDPDKMVSYPPLISGVIEKVNFSLGDKVQKGQTMLDVRSTDLSALQSEQSSLQAEIRVVERELKTAHELFDDKMMSEKELLETETKFKQTQASLAKVQNDMQLFGTDKGKGIFSLKAPMSGYIISKNVSAGSTISPGSAGSTISPGNEPLFTIADLSTVWVTINVYAGNLQSVKEGMSVSFTTLSYPDEVFEGKIDRLSQVFDPEDKILKARIVMPNKDLKLKPQMSVVVHLRNEIDEDSIVSIPSDALIFDDNRYFVVVKEANNDFQIREVRLKGHDGKTSYVQSGLAKGEEVVVKNQLLIYSGLNGK